MNHSGGGPPLVLKWTSNEKTGQITRRMMITPHRRPTTKESGVIPESVSIVYISSECELERLLAGSDEKRDKLDMGSHYFKLRGIGSEPPLSIELGYQQFFLDVDDVRDPDGTLTTNFSGTKLMSKRCIETNHPPKTLCRDGCLRIFYAFFKFVTPIIKKYLKLLGVSTKMEIFASRSRGFHLFFPDQHILSQLERDRFFQFLQVSKRDYEVMFPKHNIVKNFEASKLVLVDQNENITIEDMKDALLRDFDKPVTLQHGHLIGVPKNEDLMPGVSGLSFSDWSRCYANICEIRGSKLY